MTMPLLTEAELADLTAWRQRLHRMPELSGAEASTAAEVCARLAATRPDSVLTGLGGHGVAAVYRGDAAGPALLFRCELDALPIEETGAIPHRSTHRGRGHLCGHDGHMAILAALAQGLARARPARGRVVLLFQPAEETGAGAAAVLADPRFAAIAPDFAFALHNLPGLPLGRVALAGGPAACASRGMRIVLTGRTAHASRPASGRSPAPALARLLPALAALGEGHLPEPGFAMVTITHARLGEPAFGIAPGQAEIWATLRCLTDARMGALVARATALVRAAAEAGGLGFDISFHDVFDTVENHPRALAPLRRALDAERVPHGPEGQPMHASEDFGRFGQLAPAAMFFIGAGTDHADLHNPDYDFPDALIPVGAGIFMRVVRDMLGGAPTG